MSGHHSRSASRSSQTPRLSQGQTRDSITHHSFGRTSRVSNPNVFSDEYSLEPIDADQIDRAPSPASIASSTTLRSTHHPQKTVNTAATPTTADNENPFGDDARVSFEEAHRSSLPQKGVGGFSNNRNSVNSVNNASFALQRNQSVSSRFSIPRALSPYTGATGPSHPYAMYPQVGVSRSPSVGSTSTIRQPDRPLGETAGPQHPYAMYTQNVVEEGMDDDDNAIPVGFPGHNPPYQPPQSHRDDDVGDIIGPDGHTEPLPPYSRYPTGVIPKPPTPENMADINSTPEDHQLNSVSRDQPPVSETSSRALVADYSGNAGNNGNDQNGDNNNNNRSSAGQRAAAATGIMAFEEKLKQKGKKTACCGLPVWTLVLICTVMIIGGSIGGVIGGVLGTKRAAEADKEAAAASSSGPNIVTVTASPQKDYSTMTSTPSNLKSAPTGTYYVPMIHQNSSGMCVEDDVMKSAWKCMDKPNHLEITISEHEHEHTIVFPNPTPTSSYSYGPQPPYMTEPAIRLGMAIDTSDTSLGPALFFTQRFDKLVVVPDSKFPSSSVAARDWPGDDSILSMLSRKDVAQPGDRPWFCWWNQTQMEFFIYVNQTTSDTSTDATASTNNKMPASTAAANSESKRDISIQNYPRKIKIDERRDQAGAVPPYCQQMEVNSVGHAQPIPYKTIDIKENEPTPTTTYIDSKGGAQQTYTARAQYATPCYCLSFAD